jgi:hypothetical protein
VIRHSHPARSVRRRVQKNERILKRRIANLERFRCWVLLLDELPKRHERGIFDPLIMKTIQKLMQQDCFLIEWVVVPQKPETCPEDIFAQARCAMIDRPSERVLKRRL